MSGTERIDESGSANDAEITLGSLNAVHENERITQRSVAKDLGIALGLTNAYLKRCVKKGLIKVSQAPANRYAYYLTPTGFAEKSRLTAEYLSHSFRFFRDARTQCADAMAQAAGQGWHTIALYGMSELAEIASLSGVPGGEIVSAVAPENETMGAVHLPLVRSFDELGEVDAVLLTALNDPQSGFEALCARFPQERILTPLLLRVTRNDASLARDGGEES